MFSRRLLIAATGLVVLAAAVTAPIARAEPMRIAYLSPSFDISDAWERTFWAIQGRLDELGSSTRSRPSRSRATSTTRASSPRSNR